MRALRRIEKSMDVQDTKDLLLLGEYGILSMVNVDGGGYGVPMSYAAELSDAGDHLYFHCAKQGHKLDNLQANARVCFCVVGGTRLLPEKFTTQYRSVMAYGNIVVVEEEAEKTHAMRLLIAKYSSGFEETGEKYIEAALHKTNVLKLRIESISGKEKV